MKLKYLTTALAAALCIAGAGASLAQDSAPPVQKVTAATPPPKLIVMIAVDQFSADLFAEYRSHFTGGLARLASGRGLSIGLSVACRDRNLPRPFDDPDRQSSRAHGDHRQ